MSCTAVQSLPSGPPVTGNKTTSTGYRVLPYPPAQLTTYDTLTTYCTLTTRLIDFYLV